MTVVSIVFAILLMTLTLASTQFSPRILVSFVRDKATQWTLGIFLGTFTYCMAALPAVRSLAAALRAGPDGACRHGARLGQRGLADFLHQSHFALDQRQPHRRSHRGETELVIDELMPDPRGTYEQSEHAPRFREGSERVIVSRKSGYVRFVDVSFLVESAKIFWRSNHAGAAGRPFRSGRRSDTSGRRRGPGDPGARSPPAERHRHRPHAHYAARHRIWR